MRITRLAAKNYRTLEDVDIDFEAAYCTLSGRNNAGKSCIIRLLIFFLSGERHRRFARDEISIDFIEDHTQWANSEQPIELVIEVCLTKADDPALIDFVEKMTDRKIEGDETRVQFAFTYSQSDSQLKAVVDGVEASESDAREILRKIRDSNSIFLHNSTTRQDSYYYVGRFRAMYPINLSAEEQSQVSKAEETVNKKIQRVAKGHRDELSDMLGKLSDRYDVELTSPERGSRSEMLLAINLKDRNVEVPLDDWGSGTQNRTQILMSILQANRVKTQQSDTDKITPIVIVEEPESFLHPSAQAEFGNMLETLSSELGIQIVASTHSPYMLNQVAPKANLLLNRKVFRKKLQGTELMDTSGDEWMTPFAEHLGLVPPEFEGWREIIASKDAYVLLVEGETDKSYLEFIREHYPHVLNLPESVEIVAYGGKDALKNTMLVRFVLGRFQRCFITFDKDAEKEVKKSLESIGLSSRTDYIGVGKDKAGSDAIEGLLPARVVAEVHSKNTELIMELGAQNSDVRRSAKNKLKSAYLQEFLKHDDYTEDELVEFAKLGKVVYKAFA